MELNAQMIQEIVNKAKSDPNLAASFQKDPVKTLESLAGVEIPEGMQDQIMSGVTAALSSDKLSGVADSIKKLF